MRNFLVAAIGLLLAATPAMAQGIDLARTAPNIETPAQALTRDAAEYARRYAVPQDRAERELRAQQESVPQTDAIAREFAGRLVGIAVDHHPALSIAVILTGTEQIPDRVLHAGDLDVPVAFHVGARASQSDLVAAITQHQAAIRAALRQPPAIGVDVRAAELVVQVNSADAGDLPGLSRRFAELTGVPLRVVRSGTPANLMVPGGARITGTVGDAPPRYLCTSGYAVSDGAQAAIVTAAHCPDTVSYLESDGTPTVLPFVAQAGWGYQDVQVNASPVPLEPWFYADTAKSRLRAVMGQQARASTRVGDFVCHRGERTGYSCSEVLMTDFAPAGDLCGGACLPTWVMVDGPTCQGGDSGGPVFSGTTALGIVKGGTYRSDGSCAAYYYMSLDYLPRGWTLLEAVPLEPARSAPLPLAAGRP